MDENVPMNSPPWKQHFQPVTPSSPEQPHRRTGSPVLRIAGGVVLALAVILGGSLVVTGVLRLLAMDTSQTFVGHYSLPVEAGEEFAIYDRPDATAVADDVCVVTAADGSVLDPTPGGRREINETWRATSTYTPPQSGAVEITCTDDETRLATRAMAASDVLRIMGGVAVVLVGSLIGGLLLRSGRGGR